MKKILLAAAALMLVGPAMADDLKSFHTKDKFETTYTQIVNDAHAQGYNIETTCWKGYCAKYVQAQYSDGFSIAQRFIYDNGEEAREFCVGKSVQDLDRNCAANTGAFWREHYNSRTKTWETTQTFTTHFEDEVSEAPGQSM
jgi:hypothetical protein